jgi:hypothetical protein
LQTSAAGIANIAVRLLTLIANILCGLLTLSANVLTLVAKCSQTSCRAQIICQQQAAVRLTYLSTY